MKHKIVIGALFVVVVVFFYMYFFGNKPKFTLLHVGDAALKVELADTLGKQRQGLSGRESMPSEQGMLFIMGLPDRHSFVMREMKFPIDIVWIRDSKVVDISFDVPYPQGNEKPATVQPQVPANLVLEVNAGWTRTNRIKIGDSVRTSK